MSINRVQDVWFGSSSASDSNAPSVHALPLFDRPTTATVLDFFFCDKTKIRFVFRVFVSNAQVRRQTTSEVVRGSGSNRSKDVGGHGVKIDILETVPPLQGRENYAPSLRHSELHSHRRRRLYMSAVVFVGHRVFLVIFEIEDHRE